MRITKGRGVRSCWALYSVVERRRTSCSCVGLIAQRTHPKTPTTPSCWPLYSEIMSYIVHLCGFIAQRTHPKTPTQCCVKSECGCMRARKVGHSRAHLLVGLLFPRLVRFPGVQHPLDVVLFELTHALQAAFGAESPLCWIESRGKRAHTHGS